MNWQGRGREGLSPRVVELPVNVLASFPELIHALPQAPRQVRQLFRPKQLELALGIVCCRCQLHCEIKETFRLAIEKSVGREGLDGSYRTP